MVRKEHKKFEFFSTHQEYTALKSYQEGVGTYTYTTVYLSIYVAQEELFNWQL